MSTRLQVREPLGPLVSARSAPLPELEHYPGGRWGPYLTTALGAVLGAFSPDLLVTAGVTLPAFTVLVPFLAVLWLPPYVVPWGRRLRMRRLAAWDGFGQAPSGVTRVSGVVREVDDPFAVPGARRPVVYARTRYAQAGSMAGARRAGARTSAACASRSCCRRARRSTSSRAMCGCWKGTRSFPRWARRCAGRWAPPGPGIRARRSTAAAWPPGDRVEMVGELVRQVDVEGQGAPGRGVPMVHLIKPAWPGGIWVRRTR